MSFVVLQHSLTCFGANLSVAIIVAPAMCVTEPKDVSEILSTIFFVSGLVTLLQSTLGTRYTRTVAHKLQLGR